MSKISTEWVLKLFDRVSKPMKHISKSTDNATESGDRFGACLKRIRAIDFYAVGEGIQSLNEQLQQAIQPGVNFESELAEVSAITGVTGKALEDLGEKARESALQFGGSAADSLNTYKVLLSKLGPQLAKSPEMLEKMEHNVRILSKTMGGDTAAAVDALTTSLLQYNVNLDNPTQATKTMSDMMNVMAAGAQEGAAEVNSISQALRVSGVQLKQSNVSFVEANAAIQALAAGGKEGASAGTALRNVLAKMAGEDVIPKEAADKLRSLGVDMGVVSDTTLPFIARLKELKKAQGDATIIAQMFGIENASSAKILLQSIDAQTELQSKISGTNSATEQANVIMNTYAERMSRLNAWFKDLGISIFNSTKKMLPFIDVMGKVAFTGSQIGTVYNGLGPIFQGFNKRAIVPLKAQLNKLSLSSLRTSVGMRALGLSSIGASAGTWTLTGSIKALSAAIKSIPVVGWILAIIGALVTLFSYLWNNSEKFRGFIYGAWNVIKLVFTKIINFIKPILNFFITGFKTAFNSVWNTVKSVVLGIWNFISTTFTKIKTTISTVLTTIKTVFKTIFGGVYDAVVNVFKKIWKKVKHWMNKILSPLKKFGGWIRGLWEGLFGKDVTKQIGDAMQEGADRAHQEFSEKENQEDADQSPTISSFLKGSKTSTEQGSLIKTAVSGTKPAPTSSGISLSGAKSSTGTSNISMTINNYFTANENVNIKQLADKVAARISDVMQDALIAV